MSLLPLIFTLLHIFELFHSISEEGRDSFRLFIPMTLHANAGALDGLILVVY
jgi:hypothetical protein